MSAEREIIHPYLRPVEYMVIKFYPNKYGQVIGSIRVHMHQAGAKQKTFAREFTRPTYKARYLEVCEAMQGFLEYRRVPDYWIEQRPAYATLLKRCKVIEAKNENGKTIFMREPEAVTE